MIIRKLRTKNVIQHWALAHYSQVRQLKIFFNEKLEISIRFVIFVVIPHNFGNLNINLQFYGRIIVKRQQN